MDSITQAALGAAVGKAVLGEKMGNRAILVGAIAGTIPDLDVLSRLFTNHHIYGLVYHRGISHSIFFTLVAPPLLAWLSLLYYKKELHQELKVQQGLAGFWGVLYSLLFAGLVAGTIYTHSLVLGGLALATLFGGVKLFKTLRNSVALRCEKTYDPSYMRWTLMYVLAFGTHWFIDSCTAYGTQIFEPFSSTRVAFNNISIVDPLYTVPLLIGLIGAYCAQRAVVSRRWNYWGLAVSSLYMAITFGIKAHVDAIVERSLAEQGIVYETYITYPIFSNTILWQTTIQSADTYYYGMYSLFDSEPKVEFIKLPRNHALIEPYKDHPYVKILLWFSGGYYNLTEEANGDLTFNNLRFGVLSVPEDSSVPLKDRYVFRFTITKKDGKVDVLQDRDMDRLDLIEVLQATSERLQGH